MTMSKKQPNRLAQLIDHQNFAGSALPQSLADTIRLYNEATAEIKTCLVECLPDEILNNCFVVALTAERLTLSVSSITAANHIRYLQDAYLQILNQQSMTFQQLKQIHIVVVNNAASSQESAISMPSRLKSVKNARNQRLSQNTKRTISQAAEHVTTDEMLKKALLRLIND